MNLKRILIVVFALVFASQALVFAAGVAKGRSVKVSKPTKITPQNSKNNPPPITDDGKRSQGPDVDTVFQKFISGTHDPVRVPSDHVPTLPGDNLPTSTGTSAISFDGISHQIQRSAGVSNTQFSKEPSDTHIGVGGSGCNGGPCVFTIANTALRIYSTAGSVISTRSLHQQFALTPNYEFNRSNTDCFTIGGTNCFGDSLTDPQVYFDPPSGRWFVSTLDLQTDHSTGDLTGHTSVLIAVSTTSDPNGGYNIYTVDVTNDGSNGTPSHPNCPCFADQPLMGADANALFISANEFAYAGGFNGAVIYAFDKAAMIGGSTPNAVLFNPLTLEEGYAYSIYPAVTPTGGSYWSGNGGVEFFLSALDFFDTLDNRVAVWAVTNTSSISTTPNLALQYAIVDSEVYGAPPQNEQPDPKALFLRDCVNDPTCAYYTLGLVPPYWNVPTPQVDAGGDRMRQTTYTGTSDNKLWSALTTVVKTTNGPARAGVAYFAVTPGFDGSTLTGSMAAQGYVAVNNTGIHYPAVAVNSAGNGIISFSVTGRKIAPSAGYATVSTSGAGSVQITGFAGNDFDGFTGYFPLSGQNRPRWGDYSGACIDGNSDAWALGGKANSDGARTLLANWGSRVAKIDITP